ncbi:major histocompatibility complex class I-related gene protein-like [Rhinophrynus dorsalis]
MADPELWQTLNTDLRNDQNQMRNLSTENITIQYVHGCTIFSNGSTQVSFQIALDGIEFLRFDVETGNFSTEIEGAQEMVNQLNANRTLNQMRSDQLNLCLGLLHRLLEFGNQTINRKEVPVVQVTQKLVIYDIMTLRCSVIGHYPREVSVMWDRNGHQIPERELVRRTLPLPDHTYLSFLSVDISPVTEDIFTCQVTHSSMASPLMLKWMRSRQSQDFSSSSSGGLSSGAVIAVCLAVVLLVSVLVFGFLLCDKERRALILLRFGQKDDALEDSEHQEKLQRQGHPGEI